jgi:hypothetical protein
MEENKGPLRRNGCIPYASSEEIEARESADNQAWQMAQDRVLLYLKTLGVPARLSLELALEALRRSEYDQQAASGFNPTKAAMKALRAVLAEQQPPGSEPGVVPGFQNTIPVSPLLNCGSMTPAAMDRRLWRALVSWMTKFFRTTPAHYPDAARSADKDESRVLSQFDR